VYVNGKDGNIMTGTEKKEKKKKKVGFTENQMFPGRKPLEKRAVPGKPGKTTPLPEQRRTV